MAHQVLYRRARPRKFADVVGQDLAVHSISKAIVEERLASAILVSGHFGSGKTTLARLIAASLNCEYRDPDSAEPCGGENPECMTCPGVIEGDSNVGGVFEFDAASKGSIDAIRELINSMDRQVSARYKVYIIDEAHRLSRDAESALLKPIEEPPPNVVIILATTDPQRIKDTIRSRVTHYPLSGLDKESLESLVRRAAERFEIAITDSDVTAILAKATSGRDALSLLENWSQHGTNSESSSPAVFLRGITDAVNDGDWTSALLLVNSRYANDADEPAAVLQMLSEHVRAALIAREDASRTGLTGEMRDVAEYAADTLSEGNLYALYQALLGAYRSPDASLKFAIDAAVMEAVRRVRSSASPGATTPAQSSSRPSGPVRLEEGDKQDIADYLYQRVQAGVAEMASMASAPPAPDEPKVASVTIESDLDQASRAIATPPPPAADVVPEVPASAKEQPAEEPAGDSAPEEPEPAKQSADVPAAASLDEVMTAMSAATSRRGKMFLERHAKLSFDPANPKIIVLEPLIDRSLSDDDFDLASDAVRSIGLTLEEATP